MLGFLRSIWNARGLVPQDARCRSCREELRRAGLSEKKLRKMDPDDRVRALEQAKLDPYDYIYLAC